jgi:hypothetical protein
VLEQQMTTFGINLLQQVPITKLLLSLLLEWTQWFKFYLVHVLL